MVASEFPPDVEAELKSMRKSMRRALKAGDMAAYGRVKAEHVTRVHQEQQRARRAARDARRVLEPVPVERERWRLPFTRSPGAYERDRLPPPPPKPQVPYGGHLSPWRRGGSPVSEVLWRP